jgi:succinate dehydrogenase / fumarate reductase iron-sulfur subunit
MSPKTALLHTHKAPDEVRKLFDEIDGRDERIELNLYVTGYEDAPENQPEEEEGSAERGPPEESSMPDTPENEDAS